MDMETSLVFSRLGLVINTPTCMSRSYTTVRITMKFRSLDIHAYFTANLYLSIIRRTKTKGYYLSTFSSQLKSNPWNKPI